MVYAYRIAQPDPLVNLSDKNLHDRLDNAGKQEYNSIV